MKHLFSLVLLVVGLPASAQTTMNIYQNNGTVLQIPLSSIDSITFTVNNPGSPATVTTLPISNITTASAISGGNITNGGGTPVIQRGVCWSTNPNPTTADNLTNEGSGTGSYVSSLFALAPSTTYYVRAYAINSSGTAYGNQVQFMAAGAGGYLNPSLTYGTMTDQDGNMYATIAIGTQIWMAENLRSTTYANGDPIPNVTDGTQWTWQLTTGAWANFENNSAYDIPYGKLYNWYSVVDARNVCPTGWHVPTDAEWTVLSNFLGGESVAGGKMKSTGTQHWLLVNTGATNESGFSALPGGYRGDPNGEFPAFGSMGNWWSTSESSAWSSWRRTLGNYFEDISPSPDGAKHYGYSVRCLMD